MYIYILGSPREVLLLCVGSLDMVHLRVRFQTQGICWGGEGRRAACRKPVRALARGAHPTLSLPVWSWPVEHHHSTVVRVRGAALSLLRCPP